MISDPTEPKGNPPSAVTRWFVFLTDLMMVSMSRGLADLNVYAIRISLSQECSRRQSDGRALKGREDEPGRSEVDDLNLDSFLRENLSRFKAVSNHLRVGDDGHVGTLSLDLEWAEGAEEGRSA